MANRNLLYLCSAAFITATAVSACNRASHEADDDTGPPPNGNTGTTGATMTGGVTSGTSSGSGGLVPSDAADVGFGFTADETTPPGAPEICDGGSGKLGLGKSAHQATVAAAENRVAEGHAPTVRPSFSGLLDTYISVNWMNPDMLLSTSDVWVWAAYFSDLGEPNAGDFFLVTKTRTLEPTDFSGLTVDIVFDFSASMYLYSADAPNRPADRAVRIAKKIANFVMTGANMDLATAPEVRVFDGTYFQPVNSAQDVDILLGSLEALDPNGDMLFQPLLKDKFDAGLKATTDDLAMPNHRVILLTDSGGEFGGSDETLTQAPEDTVAVLLSPPSLADPSGVMNALPGASVVNVSGPCGELRWFGIAPKIKQPCAFASRARIQEVMRIGPTTTNLHIDWDGIGLHIDQSTPQIANHNSTLTMTLAADTTLVRRVHVSHCGDGGEIRLSLADNPTFVLPVVAGNVPPHDNWIDLVGQIHVLSLYQDFLLRPSFDGADDLRARLMTASFGAAGQRILEVLSVPQDTQ